MGEQGREPSPEIVRLMAEGTMSDCKLAPQGSNYTYFARLSDEDGNAVRVVYKPCRGEAPLWDFPDGTLYLREYLAYRLSEALGWGLVPYTVIRDGQYGVGSVQLFVPSDQRASYFTLRESHVEQIQLLCAYDVLANNADRKASHCLLGLDGQVWGIDHGIAFHWEHKLRTVIWDFAGQSIPGGILQDVRELAARLDAGGSFKDELAQHLSRQEADAFCARVEELLERKVFPLPGLRRSVPWPWV